MFIKRIFAFLMIQCALTLLSGINAQAQTETDTSQTHERLYQVEIIIFSRYEGNPQEQWSHDVKLSYPENLMSLKAEGSSSESFTMLPANERTMNPQAATLARSGSYSVLYHQAWRQMIYGRKTNIAISGGKSFGSHQELEGSIALNVGQYLKIQTNLWLTQFVPPGTNITETWPELPSLPNSASGDGEKNQGYLIKRIVKVNQDRSMRSNEIHYIDHPLLGIIVKVFPYESANTR